MNFRSYERTTILDGIINLGVMATALVVQLVGTSRGKKALFCRKLYRMVYEFPSSWALYTVLLSMFEPEFLVLS